MYVLHQWFDGNLWSRLVSSLKVERLHQLVANLSQASEGDVRNSKPRAFMPQVLFFRSSVREFPPISGCEVVKLKDVTLFSLHYRRRRNEVRDSARACQKILISFENFFRFP